MDVLLTWVGSRDLTWKPSPTAPAEPGPILGLLRKRHFDAMHVLFNIGDNGEYSRRATDVLRYCQRHFPKMRTRTRLVDLLSVIDYEEIYRLTNDACQRILADEGREGRNYYVYLSPGTPQMQTIWVLLVQSGLLPARMIDATPPRLVPPGAQPWREVDLTLDSFPQVVSPGETARLVGILEKQNQTLSAENRRLKADLGLRQAGATLADDGPIGPDFRLPDYLRAHERALYVRAFEQAEGNAAEAARLLGIPPHTFRAGAQRLGVRARRGVSAARA